MRSWRGEGRRSRVLGPVLATLLAWTLGACAAGTPLGPSSTSRTDRCNGLDDDNDGRVDEDADCRPGIVEACGAGGRRVCSGACRSSECEGTCVAGETLPCGRCGTLTCDDGRWGDCLAEGECAPGSERSCASGSERCSRSCTWDACLDPLCTPGDIVACGNCGTRTCGADGWGECEAEGECVPGATGMCGIGGTRDCDATCSWSTCTGEGTCSPGATRPCGGCGTQRCGADFNWGECEGAGECGMGDVRTCGVGGLETCTRACAWGPCEGEGECSAGQRRSCGRCGVQECKADGMWGMCIGTGACVPGSVAACGFGGTQTCGGECVWGTCMGGGECSPGTREACGRCGVRACGADFRFGPCSAEGECAPGAVESCGTGGTRVCSAACVFGSCDEAGECSAGATQPCGNCGTRACVSGTWSACMGSGPCAPGATMSCGVGGARTCSTSCAFGSCSGQTVGLRFAGSHVRLPAAAIYDFGSADFTIEMWVAADSSQPAALPVLISARVLVDVEWRGWWIGINHEPSVGPLGVVYVGNDNAFVPGASGVDLRDGTWHHVAVVHHAGDFQIFVDGTLSTTLFYPEEFTAPGPVEVGGDPEFGSSFDFHEGIFDVRIWGTARSASEIRDGMRAGGPVSMTALRARYRFAEGSGQSVADSVRVAPGTLGSTTALEPRDPAWIPVP